MFIKRQRSSGFTLTLCKDGKSVFRKTERKNQLRGGIEVRKHAVIFGLMVFILCLTMSAEAVTLKMGTKMPENHHESIALKKFADLVEERTKGEVKIQIYFGEVLGDSKKQIENMIQGLQDFYAEGYGFYDSYVKDFRLAGLPYIFKDNDDFKKFLQSDVQKEIEKQLLDKVSLRIINTEKNWLRGPYRVIASKKPVRSIDDLKGLKLRMANNPTSVRAWETLGCAVSVIPYSETYLALKQGTVEAVTCPVTDAYYQKFCEVAPYITVTYEYFQQVAIVMNDRRFRSLTPEQQDILIQSINEAGQMCWNMTVESGEKLVELMKKEYKVEMIDMDTTPLRAKIDELTRKLEAENYITPGIIDRIHNLP